LLRVTCGNEVKEFSLDQPVTAIGRGTDNLVVLTDEQVSRRHAEVEWAEGRPRITDLGSSNGTLVNGAKITPNVPYSLKVGDSIGIGSYVLTIRPSPVEKEAVVSGAAERMAPPVIPKSAVPAQRAKPSRSKMPVIIGVIVLLVIVLAGVLLAVLLPGATEEINVEVVDSLMQMNTAAIDGVGLEIDEIGRQVREIEDDLLKLEQVATPAEEWVEHQESKVTEYNKGTSWNMRVAQDGLDRLKNDRYQVTKLEYSVSHANTPQEKTSSVIEVTDLNTGSKYDLETITNTLEERKAKLAQQARMRGEKGELAIATFKEVMEGWEGWEIEKTSSKSTYIVSGHGLGWDDGLTVGSWTYYRETGEIVPRDNKSEALKDVLLAE
jgi:pSer/pThr/pTyr-binding forkhead associated (FHA) protein